MDYSFDIDVAQEFGVEEAIFLKNIQFWIRKNHAEGHHQHEGRTWTYNSSAAFEALFPFWNLQKIKRMIKKLTERRVLVCGNFNKNQFDRTRWYAFVEQDKWIKLKQSTYQNDPMHCSKVNNGLLTSEPSTLYTDINTDSKQHINAQPAVAQPREEVPYEDWSDKQKLNYTLKISFKDFWERYPVKKGKKRTRDKWMKKIKSMDIIFIIFDDLEKRCSDKTWVAPFIPHPTTYLNGELWRDSEDGAFEEVK